MKGVEQRIHEVRPRDIVVEVQRRYSKNWLESRLAVSKPEPVGQLAKAKKDAGLQVVRGSEDIDRTGVHQPLAKAGLPDSIFTHVAKDSNRHRCLVREHEDQGWDTSLGGSVDFELDIGAATPIMHLGSVSEPDQGDHDVAASERCQAGGLGSIDVRAEGCHLYDAVSQAGHGRGSRLHI